MIEYAVEGVIAANDTPPIEVVAYVTALVEDLKNGRDSRGVELMTIDGIDAAMEAEAKLRLSDVYRLKQLKVLDKMTQVLDKLAFKKKLSDKDPPSPNNSNTSDSIEGKELIQCPEPIIAPVLKATLRLREKRKEELLKIHDINKIDMEVEVRNVKESDLKKDD